MKFYAPFLFITCALYSMESSLPQELVDTLSAYLPTAPGYQAYFSPADIKKVENNDNLTKYFSYLKQHAHPTYIQTLYALCSFNSKHSSTSQDKEDSRMYEYAQRLMGAMTKDHTNWLATAKEAPYFHPLLFLKHPFKNLDFIIFDDLNWFDIKKGVLITITPPPQPLTT